MPDVSQTAIELRDWLRSLKEQSGASYADIARAIGEEERVVKRWMTGAKPSVPRGDSLLRLLDYLNVRIEPPAPRTLALSLMGEIREIQEGLRRSEARQEKVLGSVLPEIDRRLEGLVDKVAETIELLSQLEADRQPGRGVRRRPKSA